MNVLLIQSHLGRTELHPPLYPIGLVYLATALSKHNVQIIDLNVWKLETAYENLKKKIVDFKPDVAGISVRNIDPTNRRDIFNYFKTVKPTAQLVKEIRPDIKLLIGGTGFSLFAETIMSRIPEFDIGCFLEGDESVPELLDKLESPELVKGLYFRKNGDVKFTGKRDLVDFGKLPMPRRDCELIDNAPYIQFEKFPRSYNIGIQTKRGCVMKCAYCSYPFLSGSEIRLRSPKEVVDEIEYLVSLGIRNFHFVDNIFNIPISHGNQICEEILSRKLDVNWKASFEIKNITPELLRLSYKAGCRKIGLSPDAATDKTLATMQKGITEADLKENIKLIKAFPEIDVGCGIFIDMPGMNLKEYIKTLLAYIRMSVQLYKQHSGVSLGWIRILPYTEVYRRAIEEGVLSADTELLQEDEKDLAKLFYIRPSLRYLDRSVMFLLDILDYVVKPTVKFVLNALKRKSRREQ